MTSDLRAPDPTLTALHDADHWTVVSIEDGAVDGPSTAHGMDPGPDCDPADAFRRLWARDARWFAVPCRECFPDAPPEPGARWCDEHAGGCWSHDPHLAWQLGGGA